MVVGHPVYLPFRVKFRGNRVKRLKKSRETGKSIRYLLIICDLSIRFVGKRKFLCQNSPYKKIRYHL